MKSLQAKTHIALGQAFLVLTILLSAVMLNLLPDRDGAIREGRAALAEAVAVQSSTLMIDREIARLESNLEFVVERNDDLLSAALRTGSGKAVVTIGDHAGQWQAMTNGTSTDSQVVVPIWSGDTLWGQVELRFEPLTRSGIAGLLYQPWVPLVLFSLVVSFLVFYFYLGRVLKHLDPNRAVPGHVRSALDTLAEGLLVVDLKGNVVLANSSFGEITGKDPAALVGQRVHDMDWADASGERCDASLLPWVTALRFGVAQRNELLHYVDPEGTLRSFQVNSSPVLGSGGKHSGVLISFDDVTALESHKAQLRESRDEAESANRAKSEFLAAMSHEIRTPMNAILGFTHVLKRGYAKSEAEWRRYLDTIHASGTHLLQVINDVLDLSKVESGRMEVEQIPCSPYGLVAEAVSILSVKAQEKSLGLSLACDGDIPQTIVSDPTRVRQIVTNLIGNAVKFTEQGGITVTVRLIDGDEPLLCIDVTDTGVGVAPERLDAIFDPFTQADSSVTRQFGGTGLGLSISRKFARALGGDIVATSKVGVGSTFSVRVAAGSLDGVPMLSPQAVAALHEQATDEPAKPAVRFTGSRVLVVDDGEENRELARLLLEDVGLHVDEAENGKVGFDKVMAGAFDAVLMDMQMPVMSGMEATRLLREQGVSTPVIALTANAMQGSQDECMQAGCSGFLTKPIDADRLIETLADFLPVAAAGTHEDVAPPMAGDDDTTAAPTGPADSVVAPQADSAPPAEPVSGSAVYSRLALTSDRYNRIIEKFIERLHERLEEFESALNAADFPTLVSLAQWLKGSAVTVGFDAFRQPSDTLEMMAHRQDTAGCLLVVGELRGLAARLQVAPDRSAPPLAEPETVAEQVVQPQSPEPAAAVAVDAPPQGVASGMAADPRFQRIRERFVQRLLTRLDAMERCLRNGEFEDLARHGHWLKGSGGTVGYDAFTEPARELESHALERNGHGARVAMSTIRELATGLDGPGTGGAADADDDAPSLKETGSLPIR